MMFGVSPAFVLSLHGHDFSVDDFCEALPRIGRLGFTAYQPEVFHASALPEWARGAHRVHRVAETLGLVPSQFVAHFMLEWFANPERLDPCGGFDELKTVVDVVHVFSPCRVLTIPAGQFRVEWGSPTATSDAAWREMQQRLIEKIRRYLEVVSCAGLKLAFEVMPFSVIGGIRRFLDLCAQIGSPDLGLNFDTGHAWACREMVPLLPFELHGRIFGTHLGDNRSTENVKMPLGQGTIPWGPLLRNLHAAGYRGSLDIEIGCPAGEVEQHYRQGLEQLRELVNTSKGDRA
jgi:sugar phosphate isomerase/epimerase